MRKIFKRATILLSSRVYILQIRTESSEGLIIRGTPVWGGRWYVGYTDDMDPNSRMPNLSALFSSIKPLSGYERMHRSQKTLEIASLLHYFGGSEEHIRAHYPKIHKIFFGEHKRQPRFELIAQAGQAVRPAQALIAQFNDRLARRRNALN